MLLGVKGIEYIIASNTCQSRSCSAPRSDEIWIPSFFPVPRLLLKWVLLENIQTKASRRCPNQRPDPPQLPSSITGKEASLLKG